ncbi:hypothetical protein GCM10010250_55150 [Streptomyces althioticus]|uniref:DUF3618 domain-containing protein n=1 Tax=Streptomyces griseorubens TaxID=66897 RepID=A0ABR4T6C5_9ACTN|nr:hypothetical protein ASR50_09280 [Streptomyces sp. 4F]KEG42810.1 hypothetical protein DJ64_29120 [Streptomyces griseorubens]MBM4831539.1 DUF3618 domain-containing protein [Actinospica acidiphila]GGQ76159.1 hypothetical protein GCM10010250_55150 [Streptomyces althioticus]GGT68412.1 hypothetical protein GCM10010243_54210 [Streptomyces matensis]
MTHDVRGSASPSGAHVDAGSEAARGAKGPDELRREIERTRHELGDTVEELAGKMDVKARARARADELKDRAGAMSVQMRSSAAHAGEVGKQHRTQLMAAAGALVMLAVGAAVMAQRRHH